MAGPAAPPPDPPLHVRRRLFFLLSGPAIFLVSVVVSPFPAVAEALYGRQLGPALSWALSHVTGIVPFSVAELLVALFVFRQLHGVVSGVRSCVRKRRRWRNAIPAGALRLGADAGVIVALFYVLWGFHYARPSVEERLGWPPGDEARIEVIEALAGEMVIAANDAYREIHGSDDAGAPTRLEDPGALDRAIESGWQRAAAVVGIAGPAAARFGRAKRLVASPLLDRLGLSGFYFPMTGEANVNRGVPAVSYPQVVAHEKSHQRGIAPEDEANFFGFLAASLAPDPVSRYAALVFAQRQLLFTLLRSSPGLAEGLVAQRLPGVQRDVDDLHAYWNRHRGRARTISRAMNDAYLRTNRVEGGVQSYGRSVELLVSYARGRGGTLR